jgi:hypothetical protein
MYRLGTLKAGKRSVPTPLNAVCVSPYFSRTPSLSMCVPLSLWANPITTKRLPFTPRLVIHLLLCINPRFTHNKVPAAVITAAPCSATASWTS